MVPNMDLYDSHVSRAHTRSIGICRTSHDAQQPIQFQCIPFVCDYCTKPPPRSYKKLIYLFPSRYLICLTIAPAFFTAAIYLCLGRIVIVYGEDISRLRPRTYTIIFITCDVIALILQAAGGAITSIADSDQQDLSDMGVNIMIAGLAFQVASLTLFIALATEFALRVRKAPEEMRNAFTGSIRKGLKWRLFLWGESANS